MRRMAIIISLCEVQILIPLEQKGRVDADRGLNIMSFHLIKLRPFPNHCQNERRRGIWTPVEREDRGGERRGGGRGGVGKKGKADEMDE